MENFLLIANVAATFFLTGAVWVVQLVQYPFFRYFDPVSFPPYHAAYRFWITPVVAPPMIVELFTAILLIFFAPENLDPRLIWGGLVLTLIIWASTFFIQIPLHEKLARGFDSETVRTLVKTNWIRTIAWSLRSLLALGFVWQVVRS